MKRLSERLDYLENTNYNNNTHTYSRNNETETISWSPFDFKTIFDNYNENYYLDITDNNNSLNNETECPALDLIADHYAEDNAPVEPSCNDANTHTHTDDDDDDYDDDDMFEVIRIEPGSELDFSYSFSLPK